MNQLTAKEKTVLDAHLAATGYDVSYLLDGNSSCVTVEEIRVALGDDSGLDCPHAVGGVLSSLVSKRYVTFERSDHGEDLFWLTESAVAEFAAAVCHRLDFNKKKKRPGRMKRLRAEAMRRQKKLAEAHELMKKAQAVYQEASNRLSDDFDGYEAQDKRDSDLDEQMGEWLVTADTMIDNIEKTSNHLLFHFEQVQCLALALKKNHPERFPCLDQA